MALVLSQIFGLKVDVKENVWFADEQNLIYPSGHNVVIYDALHKTQKFISTSEKGEDAITALSVSPNKRFIAIAESSEKATITIYDIASQRKKRTLVVNELATKSFTCVSFSADSKYLLAQGGAPDWTLVCWHWEKGKQIGTMRTSNPSNTLPLHFCSFNSHDPSLACVTGQGLLKLLRCTDSAIKPIATSPIVTLPSSTPISTTSPTSTSGPALTTLLAASLAPQANARREPNLLCHVWVGEERLVVGTDMGELLLFDMGECRAVLPQSPGLSGGSVDAIVAYGRGFVCGGSSGVVHVFEKTEDKEYYKRVRSMKVDNGTVQAGSPGAAIKGLAISGNEETLACTLENNQIHIFSLSLSELIREPALEHLPDLYHGAGVTGLDVCVRKSLVVTCSTDRTVRIWNYKQNSNELTKYFPEEAYSIAFHPSGYHKLRFMNLLMGDISRVYEVDIRSCRECRFSNGGQFFAAVNGNMIQIFSAYTFENIGNLRGHSGKVRTIYWSQDDTKIISAGLDGAVYEWDVRDGKRLSENVLKSCNYSSVVCGEPGSNSIFAVGSDKKLKELADSQVNKDLDCEVCLTQVAISRSGKVLFAGTETGSVRVYRIPLNGDFTEHQVHAGPVARLRVSYDDTRVFSVGEDGSVAILEIRDKDRKAPPPRSTPEVEFAEETLVARSDMEEKQATINEMKNKYDELTLQHEYQTKLRELNHSEKTKELGERMTHDVDAWRTKYEALSQEKNEAEMEYIENTKQLEGKHQNKIQELDRKYQQKIVDEVERYHHLLQSKEEMQEDFERQIAMIKQNHSKFIQEMSEEYASKYRDDISKLEKGKEEKEELIRNFEETKRQIEDDGENEMEEMREMYESKLNGERQTALRLKGDTNIMKKRFSSLQKDIIEHKEEINNLFEQKKQLYHTIHNLEKEILGLKKEIKERDETIGDKEKRIYDLKKKNQELEKFKFVLDYKIKELKKQIEPLNLEIVEMRGQIKEMDGELERYHKTCAGQDLVVSELKMKVEALNKEIVNERQRKARAVTVTKRMKADLQELSQLIQTPKELKEGVKKMFQKYLSDEQEDGEGNGVESDIQKEYQRQREYLEKTVASLRRKLQKDSELHRHDNIKIMQENMALISEINSLRRELKTLKQAQKEKDLNLSRTHSPKASMHTVTSTMMEDQVALDSSRIIEMQKEEIKRQRARISELEATAPRPYSRERLPPMEGVLNHDL